MHKEKKNISIIYYALQLERLDASFLARLSNKVYTIQNEIALFRESIFRPQNQLLRIHPVRVKIRIESKYPSN